MVFASKKNVAFMLSLLTGGVSPVYAISTAKMNKAFVVSAKAESVLYLATAIGVSVARNTDESSQLGKMCGWLEKSQSTPLLGITLAGKTSDIVGSALELPKVWTKELAKELAVAAVKIGIPLDLVVLEAIGKVIDTAIFNKINALVNKRFSGADQQVKRRIVRVALMVIPRCCTQLIGVSILHWMVASQGQHLQTMDRALWQKVLLGYTGQATLEHALTECAGAALAQLIDAKQVAAGV